MIDLAPILYGIAFLIAMPFAIRAAYLILHLSDSE